MSKLNRLVERELRLRQQVRVFNKELVRLMNHKMEAYDKSMQPIVDNLNKKVNKLKCRADIIRFHRELIETD